MFDKEKNVFIFERVPDPTNNHEKLQLSLMACIRVGEEVVSAIFGSLNTNTTRSRTHPQDAKKIKN